MRRRRVSDDDRRSEANNSYDKTCRLEINKTFKVKSNFPPLMAPCLSSSLTLVVPAEQVRTWGHLPPPLHPDTNASLKIYQNFLFDQLEPMETLARYYIFDSLSFFFPNSTQFVWNVSRINTFSSSFRRKFPPTIQLFLIHDCRTPLVPGCCVLITLGTTTKAADEWEIFSKHEKHKKKISRRKCKERDRN